MRVIRAYYRSNRPQFHIKIYIYMCVCVYIYSYISICIDIYVFIYIYKYIRIYVYIYVEHLCVAMPQIKCEYKIGYFLRQIY